MSDPRIRTVQVLDSRLVELARVVREDHAATVLDDEFEAEHLIDEQLIAYCAGAVDARELTRVEKHLDRCTACAEEVSHLRDRGTMWEDATAAAAFHARVRAVITAPSVSEAGAQPTGEPLTDTIGRMWGAITEPFTISLRSMMIPQGAYGESKEEETSTLEFFITQEGKIVDGLRGLLKRVNREYYVRVFAIDPGARTRYGDRKAVVMISDTHQERPILNRIIDIGVTVLLGTDFRLTDNSSLAVEMLPS
jgi:hypothetical protein